MTPTERRHRLRRILHGDECVHPATVWDPISARLADGVGYEVGVLPGSLAAATVLGAPDIILLTLTEFAEQARRVTRYSRLSLIADADHGYGNALNAMRAVEELEAAGVAGLTLEDTLLPAQFGKSAEEMAPVAEMVGKLKAALRARADPSLVIVGRTNALRSSNLSDCVERLRAYAQAGADAVMVVGVKTLAEVEAIGRAASLPVVLGNVAAIALAPLIDRAVLASHRVRVAFQGPLPFLAAVKAVHDTLRHLKDGGAPAALAGNVATDDFFNQAVRRADYAGWQKEFLS